MVKSFRLTQIIPPAEELLDEEGLEYYIPKNKVGEAYKDTFSYFDTHFRLLREDLLEPYRKAVKELRRNYQQEWASKRKYDDGRGNKENNWSTSIQVYRNVEYLGMKAGREGIEYGVHLEMDCFVDWENSRLLMNNSLLCISQDGFLTFFWATVCNRNSLGSNILGLRQVDGHELNLQTETMYSMFESTKAYYEAYIHALKVLQRPEMENILFKKQLVYLGSSLHEEKFSFDWKRICKFPSLDDSQEAAIKLGLTKKLAIIQGPPGTGKTFTGLLIVKSLLHIITSCPILVVCYTNRALDQFLEGIYAFEQNLVRMGSRTRSKILGKVTLQHLLTRRKTKRSSSVILPKYFRNAVYRATRKTNKLAKDVEKALNLNGDMFGEEEWSNLSSEYLNACSKLQEAKINSQSYLLSQVNVVGMTTTFAARNYELLTSLKSEIIVVEEAAEVLEGQILGCLNPGIKHLILIGDHMQLRPSVASSRLAERNNLDVSMFERLVKGEIEYKTLEVQRRMRPAISAPLVSRFYPMLRDHQSVHDFQDVKGVKKNVFFMDHQNPEDLPLSRSRSNAFEADMVVQFCIYLTNCCGYSPRDITILSMYRYQTEQITEKISNFYHLPGRCSDWISIKNIVNPDDFVPRVRSVDEFQGDESNIILLSLVRNINSNCLNTSEKAPQSIGFLRNPNRICVALSRARIGLYIFGNAKLLSDNSDDWRDIMQHFTNNGCVGKGLELCCPKHSDNSGLVINRAEDLREYNDGRKIIFCNKKCKEKLICGHKCPKKCHYGGHENFNCMIKCKKKIEACGHQCKKVCHADSYDKECFPCLECPVANNVFDSFKDISIG
ncbi:hypothetical protein SUGI_0640290 [Cryptomeria japonica]|uniref:uncharacterized protein LOC131052843 n=1 Tax=Cryptomeria japonica TaxID=3369 RepID=UPI002414C34D|nr:uncharacterized protein LOC131052843 [Cryptomeria japonica]GLJ31821.1 hypothetical protein SUGI_0640290 [Cryptomeria japonica]